MGHSQEQAYSIKFGSWIREINKNAEGFGMNTVVCVHGPSETIQEVYLFDNWGSLTKAKFTTWIHQLKATGVKDETATSPNLPVCNWYIDNID